MRPCKCGATLHAVHPDVTFSVVPALRSSNKLVDAKILVVNPEMILAFMICALVVALGVP